MLTIGNKLEENVRTCSDLMKQYYLDVIGNIALAKVIKYLEDRLRFKYTFDDMPYMCPGSLGDWPIEE